MAKVDIMDERSGIQHSIDSTSRQRRVCSEAASSKEELETKDVDCMTSLLNEMSTRRNAIYLNT
jgi:hypothetical protein